MSKRPTMQQIADRAGVSRTAVSFILNDTPGQSLAEETRQRVLKAAEDLGYVHKRPFLSRTVALPVRRSLNEIAQAAFLVEVSRGLSEILEQRGMQVRLFELPPSGKYPYLEWIEKNNFAGTVLFNVLRQDMDELLALAGTSHAAVTIHSASISGLPAVGVDNVQAGLDAVTHLIELGHKRVSIITYGPKDHIISLHRLTGYRQALELHGLPYDETLVQQANFTSQSGFHAMRALLALNDPPTAVFVTSDVVAVGAIDAAKQRGYSVPDDISFVGFDDLPLTNYLTPPLTTVRQPGIEIGRLAAETLLRQLNGETKVPSVLLDTTLVVRGSTAPPKLGQDKDRSSIIGRRVDV